MAYATKEDMIKRFGEVELIQITDKSGLGQIDDEAFAQAQMDGDADIEIRIQSHYPLPLAYVPTVLVRLACDLYRFYLYGPQVPEQIEKRYHAAIKVLDQVNAGTLNLNPDANQEPPETSGPSLVKAPAKTFGDDLWEKYWP